MDAGITKQTLYEVDKSQFTRTTYERGMESLNAINGEIEDLVQAVWGLKNGTLKTFRMGPKTKRLLASLNGYGHEVPILVRPHPTEADTFQIMYGHRGLALRELK